MLVSAPQEPMRPAVAIAEILRGRRVIVLAGAGCSTESGIPDYRGPDSGQRARRPIQYQEFVRSDVARVRYWARSVAGWSRVAKAQPNAGHTALAELEVRGVVQGVITQNVDGLHHRAGSKRVVELHGSLALVRCLDCGAITQRTEFQQRLVALNHGWATRLCREVEAAPDGDAELDALAIADFHVPACACGGIMKPDVVFFGENVPRRIVEEAWQLFEAGDLLLVLGSSLTVYSGRRFVYRARVIGMPIVVVNSGETRADEFAAAKIDARIGDVLPRVAELL